MNTGSALGPSRIIIRDGRLVKGGRIENKTENIINRRTGAAQHPRSNERNRLDKAAGAASKVSARPFAPADMMGTRATSE